jgi:hypothetical protein
VPGHPPLAVPRDHTVVFDEGGVLAINPVSTDAVALVAAIDPSP